VKQLLANLRRFLFPTPKEVAQKQLRKLLPEHQAEMWDDLIGTEYHRPDAMPGTNERDYKILQMFEGSLSEFRQAFLHSDLTTTELDYDLDYSDLLYHVDKAQRHVHAARREYEQLLFGGKTNKRLAHERGQYVPEEDEENDG
jgi:hypothetical protein